MNKTFSLWAALAALAAASPAYADDMTSRTTIQQDANGDYNKTTAHEWTDANGNVVGKKTNVDVDADGNARVSKTVKAQTSDAYGNSTSQVTQHTIDTNGGETTKRYEEETNAR